MSTHVAFLRAINVAGHATVRMDDLRDAFAAAGCKGVRTYIRSATALPAKVMGRDRDLGTIEAGKRADLVLVEGDPLARISDLRRVKFVVSRGWLYDVAPLWRSVDFRP